MYLICAVTAPELVLPVVFGFGLVILVALLVVSPLLPLVLGAQYRAAQGILPWLAAMPLLTGCFYVLGDILTSTGSQATRSLVQFLCVLAKIPLSIVLARQFGFIGTIWAVLGSSVVLLAVTLAIVVVSLRREPAAAVA